MAKRSESIHCFVGANLRAPRSAHHHGGCGLVVTGGAKRDVDMGNPSKRRCCNARPSSIASVRRQSRWRDGSHCLWRHPCIVQRCSGPSAGEAAREQRVALGVPRFGIDFDATNLPHEASLEHVAVAFDKGCYLGQEVVCMVEMRGQVQKRLVRLHGASPLAGEVTADGEVVGTVRSSAKTNAGFAALALVRRKALEQGKLLAVANVPVTSELILQPKG
jgi:folate-binding protein YgfZ